MSTPIHEIDQPRMPLYESRSSDEGTATEHDDHNHLSVNTANLHLHNGHGHLEPSPSPSQSRDQATRLDDDLAMLKIERVVSSASQDAKSTTDSMHRSRSRGGAEPIDDFDAATNPIHEMAMMYKPPENPAGNFAKFFKKIHNSSILVRWFTYIVPLFALLLIPLLLAIFVFPKANVGGVSLLWFSVWLEIVWLTLWLGRLVAKCIPWPLGLVMTLFTNNAKKWRDLGKQLEIPATLFFWWLGVEISFLPTMKNHHVNGDKSTKSWEKTVNKIIISLFVGVTLNFVEKIIIQLIAISFHLRTYQDRIEVNKFQIGSLTKLYTYSKEKIRMEDSEFDEKKTSGLNSGTRTPMMYADQVQKKTKDVISKVGDVAGAVAGDFTGKKINKSNHPSQVILTLLNSTSGSQILARRLYRTFVRDGEETVSSDDLKAAFDSTEEADAAFTMFDKDLNGDISMEELEAVCVEIGRERKSITASLKDLDSVVSKLDDVLVFVVLIITVLVLLSLLSTSAAGVLTSAGSTILALSWLLSATAQEFLQSLIFVFIKHPFDVGDRVSIYGNTGSTLTGDDYFVKEISLLYTEFKKMEGHVVQAPNSVLNTLFMLNMRRSGGLAEAVPIVIKFGTTLSQIEELRIRLLEFVSTEKREYQANILTELRNVTENWSITLNVIFFYKSNWQNELLRLQRRNKFICTMMMVLQELGIEGPYKNTPGARQDIPYHIKWTGQAPPGFPSGEEPNNMQSPSVQFGGHPTNITSHPSILRTGRNRGESVASMSKRVDFSLGASDNAAADPFGDVTSSRSRSRPNAEIARLNQLNAEAIAEEREKEEEAKRTSMDRDHGSTSGSDAAFGRGGLLKRASTDLEGKSTRSSMSHRNRFFGRGRADSTSRDREMRDLEAGTAGSIRSGVSGASANVIDPRSGTVTPQAIRDDTDTEVIRDTTRHVDFGR